MQSISSEKKIVGRFAPSPSGRMHLGNVYAALISWLSAKAAGGKWILRIEDLDRQRCKKEYSDLIISDLRWLGLDWDGQIFFQSERDAFYQKAFDRLKAQGMVYDCFCRRADAHASSAPHKGDIPAAHGGHERRNACRCRELSIEQKAQLLRERIPAQRLYMENAAPEWTDGHYGKIATTEPEKGATGGTTKSVRGATGGQGDFIIRRADKNFSYQLAVVVDDALMGVNQVVRGADLISSTAGQIFLCQKLGFTPPEFFHIPLLLSSDGRRLSKRDKDIDMAFFRENSTPQKLIGKVAHLSGLTDREEPLSLNEAVSLFDWKKIPTKDISILINN